MQRQAREYLNRDRLSHIDMLEALDTKIARVLCAGDAGVLLLIPSCGVYMVSAESPEFLRTLLPLMDRPELIVTHQPSLAPLLCESFGLEQHMLCYQCVYLSDKPLAPEIPQGIALRALTLDETDFVMDNYENEPDRDYIKERINAGMIGAFDGDRPVGFIGTHAEGSMGLLHLRPEYRRRGIAYALEAAMINHLLAQGRTPYGQVVTTNKASLLLQEKLQMRTSDKTLVWLTK